MSFGPLDYLRHILDECDFLIGASTNLKMEEFLSDPVLRRACQRSFEIIGEAAKNIPASYRQEHPGVPWREMSAMRDRLIHGYFGVDDAIVWDVIQGHIPPLQAVIKRLIEGD